MAATPNDPSAAVLETQQAADTAVDVGKTLIDIAKTLQGSLKSIIDMKLSALVESGEIALLSSTFDMYKTAVVQQQDLDRSTMLSSQILERITGLNAIARKEFSQEADQALGRTSMIKAASDNLFAVTKEYATSSVKLLDGTKIDMALVMGDVDSLMKTFTDTLADDTRLQVAAMEGMNYGLVENMKLAGENLNISTATMNDIFQKELSATGKITGDFLKDYEKTLISTSQLTGVSIDLIGKDLARMTADFNHFGMMTTEQMGSLSAKLKYLGLDISDVTRLADNFSSFDKAASTMSNLAASTGATLDTLELFRLANTDQEAFITSLRDQLESQGVEFENLNIIQQKQIAQSFGLDPRVMQRLLSDNFTTLDSIASEIGEKKDRMTDETLRSTVAGMGSLREEMENLDLKKATTMIASLKSASAETAETMEHLERTTIQFATIGVDRLTTGINSMVDQAKLRRGELMKVVHQGIESMTTDPETKKLYHEMGQNAGTDVKNGLEAIRPDLYKVANEHAKVFIKGWKDGSIYMQPGSPSAAGRDITKGITLALEKMIEEKTVERAGEKMSKELFESVLASRRLFGDKIKELDDLYTIESSKVGGDPMGKVKARFKDTFTDAQITAILEGRGADVVVKMVEASAAARVEAAKSEEAKAKAEEVATKSKKPTADAIAESAERLVNIKITLAGGDALTDLLAKHIVTAGLKGISVDNGQLIHLASLETYEGRPAS